MAEQAAAQGKSSKGSTQSLDLGNAALQSLIKALESKQTRLVTSVIAFATECATVILMYENGTHWAAAEFAGSQAVRNTGVSIAVQPVSSWLFIADVAFFLIPLLMLMGNHVEGSRARETIFDVAITGAALLMQYLVFNLAWVLRFQTLAAEINVWAIDKNLVNREGNYLITSCMLAVVIFFFVMIATKIYGDQSTKN